MDVQNPACYKVCDSFTCYRVANIKLTRSMYANRADWMSYIFNISMQNIGQCYIHCTSSVCMQVVGITLNKKYNTVETGC